MDVYKREEEQIEIIKNWWRENGKPIVVGIAVGLTVIFGWRGYQSHLATTAEGAGILYEQMLSAHQQNNRQNMRVYAERIIEEYQSTLYASLAGLMLAKLAIGDNDLDGAEIQLRRILTEESQAEINHITRLRLIRVLMANNKLDSALATINKIDLEKFAGLYAELLGDIYVQQGEISKASEAYQKALLAATMEEERPTAILQMKLDDLGGI